MVEVKLHDIGEGMTEADITSFLVQEGDRVKADDPLVEIQTDKMTAEIPAPTSGVIKKILLKPGITIEVGTTLLIMDTVPTENQHGAQNSEKQLHDVISSLDKGFREPLVESNQQNKQEGRVIATPYTRKIARENDVDLQAVKGTGPAGRITDEDVQRFIQEKERVSSAEQVETAPYRDYPSLQFKESADMIPFRGRRRQIAKKMTQSLQTIPHCTHFEEVDMSNLLQMREEFKTAGHSISATAFFIKALSICFKEFPIFNAQLNEEKEEIQLKKDHHIGIAVDTKEGLIVPVIRDVVNKTITEIHLEMKRLTQLALEDGLTLQDISGGTFTISNVGPLGGSIGATPIIQHPQTALVSFHKTKKRPVVTDDDQIVIRSIMNISMSFDHRVADGATAVSFTNRFTKLIENPKLLLLELI